MSGLLDRPSPRWFTIPAHRPFLEDLAAGVWRALTPLGEGTLADALILVPTRRAERSLGEAFLKVAESRAVILPRIRALGDLDEGEPPFEAGAMALDLPPAITPRRRRFELAGLVVAHAGLLERRLDAVAALELADALGDFLDSCQIAEAGDAKAVASLVDGELARHWRISAAFLDIALTAWPARLKEMGLIDVAARRVALLRRLADRWRDRPTEEVVIAAGSTGSSPASADLLAAVAGAPKGCVVLPGLDTALADRAWEEVGEQHPQGAMKRLIARAGVGREAVADWDGGGATGGAGRWRRRVINAALRPPEATSDWLDEIKSLRAEGATSDVDPIAEGLNGLTVITARTEEEAATAAALLLREALEQPGRTAALITPDAALARRVSARLTRWNITADSSAGQPLAGTPAAVLAHLVARATIDPLDPVILLAIVKHPLTRLGRDNAALDAARVALERDGLRGPRPATASVIGRRLDEARDRARRGEPRRPGGIAATDAAQHLLETLRSALARAATPYQNETATVAAAAEALGRALEALATGPGGGLGGLWSGQGGEALGQMFAGLIAESGALPLVTRSAFAELLDGLMAREPVRPGGASHPRLRILGVLEARLTQADVLILAGLEEGMWPAGAPIDPFLSRPMRQSLGLPPPERRVGLSAHDFAQAACAPEVVLLHSDRRDGAPAVASRWLWRLRTLVKGAGLDLPGRPDILAWARALDAPIGNPPDFLRTAPRPNPMPPVAVRPRRLAVTAVERWIRDPYGLYAREILKLRPLDRPAEPLEARARGTAIHAAFERFALENPDTLPTDAEARFAEVLVEALRRAGMPESRMAREQALAANLAPWAIAFERQRRPGARLIVEQQGQLVLDSAPGGAFTLTAKADRIEARGSVADILDFKSGQTPSSKQVRSGLAPQLTLTAAILAGGGFVDLGPIRPGDLIYVRVSGGRVPGEAESHGVGDASALAADALAGLKRRLALFDDPSTGYLSWATPQFIGRLNGDYDHLARLWEWHVVGDTEADA